MTEHARLLRQDGELDGRGLRSAYTRNRIIDAVRWYSHNGDFRPRIVDVAHRAGCSVRSVFQHWMHSGELRREALSAEDYKRMADMLRAMPDAELVEVLLTGTLPKAPRA